MGDTALKLGEISTRIYKHLQAFAVADKPPHGMTRGWSASYWQPNAWQAGSRVGVRYISYQASWFLTKADALSYLAWMDAGNVGKHWKMHGGIAP